MMQYGEREMSQVFIQWNGHALGCFNPCFTFSKKRVVNGSTRKPYGTLYDLDIVLFCINVTLLENIRSITLCGGDKSCTHLYAVSSELHDVEDILPCIDSATSDYGNLSVQFRLRLLRLMLSVRVIFRHPYLLARWVLRPRGFRFLDFS